MSIQLEDLTDSPITLTLERSDDGTIDSVNPITWKINPHVEQYLSEHNLTGYLLMVFSSNQEETGHMIVPLAAKKDFLTFTRPGLNTLTCTVIYSSVGKFDRKRILNELKYGILKFDQPELVPLNTQISTLYNQLHDCESRIESNSLSAVDADELEVVPDVSSDSTTDERIEALQVQIRNLEREGRAGQEIRLSADEILRLRTSVQSLTTQLEKLEEQRWTLAKTAAVVTSILPSMFLCERVPGQAQYHYDVPSNMFAPDNKVLTWLAGRLEWPTITRDQCHRRGRALAGLLTLVAKGFLAVLSELIMAIIVIVLIILGKRDIDYSALAHPLQDGPPELFFDLGPSIWTTKRKNGHLVSRSFFVTLVSPPSLIFVALALTLMRLIGFSRWDIIAVAVSFALALVLTFIMVGIGYAITSLHRKYTSTRSKRPSRISTSGAVTEVPSARRSTTQSVASVERLSYYGRRFKSLVCRPIAR